MDLAPKAQHTANHLIFQFLPLHADDIASNALADHQCDPIHIPRPSHHPKSLETCHANICPEGLVALQNQLYQALSFPRPEKEGLAEGSWRPHQSRRRNHDQASPLLELRL